MEPVRVLVSGVAGGVGQAIVKALRMASLPATVIGVDITALAPGMYWCDESGLFPKVEEDGALDAIVSLVGERRIDAVMVGSEYELAFFADNRERIESETGATVIVSPPETVALATDKWQTFQFLSANGLPSAEAALPDSLEDALSISRSFGYPVFLKPRTGTSSSGVHMIHDDDEMTKIFPLIPDPMVQRPAGQPSPHLHQELTCSVFRCADGSLVGPFTARRTLKNGASWIVEVAAFDSVHPLLLAIAEKLDIVGSFNVQLMDGTDGPVPFEFNARFSGTTAIRAHFGFNEPEIAIRSYVLGETVAAPVIGKGLSLRYMEELYLDDASAADLGDRLAGGNQPQ